MMQTASQRIIHKSIDDYGPIEVIDEGMTRSLYFGTRFKQSCMLLQEPDRLVLDYTRAMMAPLALLDTPPENILILGLGGGSHAKFLHRLYPDARIDIVELRKNVIKIATAYFSLNESEKIYIITGNAHLVADSLVSSKKKYDVILLDIFTGNDIATDLNTTNLLQNCKRLLTQQGFCSINLWKNSNSYKDIYSRLNRSFPHAPFVLQVPGKQNIIHFGFCHAPDKLTLNRALNRTRNSPNSGIGFLSNHLEQLARNRNPVTRIARRLLGLL